jgi:hypothetical protein
MNADLIIKFELEMLDTNGEKLRLVYDGGEYKGTPGTNGIETAETAIAWLKKSIAKSKI